MSFIPTMGEFVVQVFGEAAKWNGVKEFAHNEPRHREMERGRTFFSSPVEPYRNSPPKPP